MNKIIINTENGEINLTFEFLDNPTAKKIKESLPLESMANTWGDEIYFDTNITAPVQDETLDVKVGDIAYWPEGKCLCLFFGRTPMSLDDKPVPASEVMIVGKFFVDLESLIKVKYGDNIKIQ